MSDMFPCSKCGKQFLPVVAGTLCPDCLKPTKSALQQLAEDADLSVRSYSGRFMFGKSCLGIEGDNLCDIFAALFQAAADTEPDMQEVADQVRNARSDQMGLGSILYFPSVPFINEDEDEEDYTFEEVCDRGF